MNVAWEIARGAGELVGRVLLVVIPLMILMQALQEFRLIERFGRYVQGLVRLAGLSQQAIFPLLVGLVLGVTYGAGALMEVSRKGLLSRAEAKTVGLFLGLCHSLVEDTALFLVLGASFAWLVGARLVIAVVMAAATRPLLGRE